MNIQTWAVGVTAAPRKERTLERTLASLAAAGFPAPRVFADGDVAVADGYERTYRFPAIGGGPNFWLAVTELVAREPKADAFLVVQDDVILCREARLYASQFAVPDDCGVVSLYCPACNNRPFGWHPMPVGYGMAGALAFSVPAGPGVRVPGPSLDGEPSACGSQVSALPRRRPAHNRWGCRQVVPFIREKGVLPRGHCEDGRRWGAMISWEGFGILLAWRDLEKQPLHALARNGVSGRWAWNWRNCSNWSLRASRNASNSRSRPVN